MVAGRAQELERTRPFGVLADASACTGSSPDPRRRAIAALLATQLELQGPGRTRLTLPLAAVPAWSTRATLASGAEGVGIGARGDWPRGILPLR